MEDSDSVTKVVSYDGQTIWMEGRVALYEVGNYLGGGAAGTVYEAEHAKTKEHFALKILNPLGYKLLSPALIRRCAIISKGKPVAESAERAKEPLSLDHVWWLHNSSTKQFLAAFYSERQRALHELSLVQCMHIWGTSILDSPVSPSGGDVHCKSPGASSLVAPSIPPKYADFLRRRARIFREIRNMRNISHHINVIRLENVLELAQDSKCTIFLVMELANGGELFDRIKIDCGTREKTAKRFFLQLLSGVRHCHEEGVCHRDLKPENLLLQDTASAPDGSILKIADFGFSARVAMAEQDEIAWDPSAPPLHSSTIGSPMRILRSVVGSPFYVAPEVLQAQGYDGRKADAWSIGVILYAMLAGNLPFSQELGTCKRFKQFGLWAAEMTKKSSRFWEEPGLEYPPWLFSSKFSPLARSLIVAMLLPDPILRLSVQESQEHPWCEIENGDAIVPLAKVATSTSTPTAHSTPPSGLGIAFAAPVPASTIVVPAVSAVAPVPVVPAIPVVPTVPQSLLHAMSCATDEMARDDDVLDRGASNEDDDEDDEDTMEEEQQFVMDEFSDDDDEARMHGAAFKKSKKSPGSHLYDPSSGTSKTGISQSLFPDSDSQSLPSAPPGGANSTDIEYAFRSVTVSGKESKTARAAPAVSFPSRQDEAISEPYSRPSRRNFTTPPPIPSNAVPYIVAGTPDLIGDLDIMGQSSGMPYFSYSPQGIDHTLVGRHQSRGFDMDGSNGSSYMSESQLPQGQQYTHPPSFHDAVKRSTRFITSVPAGEVLETVESILEQCRMHRTSSPIGLIGRVELHWESYRLDVWGVHDLSPTSPPLCTLHLYQLPNSTPPVSPARDMLGSSPALGASYGTRALGMQSQQQLYLVEFVRGQLEIFQFKRFYEWVRQKVSELVKRDYAFNCFDQAGSPIVPSNLADSPRIASAVAGMGQRRGFSTS